MVEGVVEGGCWLGWRSVFSACCCQESMVVFTLSERREELGREQVDNTMCCV